MQNYYASYSVALNEQFSIEPYFTFRKERWTYKRIELGELLRYKKFSTGFGLFGENGGGPLPYSFQFGYQTDRFRALFGTVSFPSYISTRSTNSYEISFRWKILKMTGNNLVKPTSIFLS